MPKPVPLPGHPPRVYYTNKEGKPVSRLLYNHNHGPVTEEQMGEERLEEKGEVGAAQRHHDTITLIQRLPQQEPNLIEVLSEKERKAEQELAKEEEDEILAQAIVERLEESYRVDYLARYVRDNNP